METIENFNEIFKILKDDIPIKITVMTISSFVTIDENKNENKNENENFSLVDHKQDFIVKNGTRNFYNCKNYTYNNKESNIKIKHFKNGSLQINGVKSIEMAYKVLKDFQSFSNSNVDIIAKSKITMINCNYKIDKNYSIQKLHKLLKQQRNLFKSVSYNPCIYHGTILKDHNKSTALIFSSGAVNLISTTGIKGIYEIYEKIKGLLNDNPNQNENQI